MWMSVWVWVRFSLGPWAPEDKIRRTKMDDMRE